jgi:hypothetical protein
VILVYFMLGGDNAFGNAFYSAVDSISIYFHIDPYVGWFALSFLQLS